MSTFLSIIQIDYQQSVDVYHAVILTSMIYLISIVIKIF